MAREQEQERELEEVEEPIVNAPSQCIKALVDGRVDFVVTENGIYDRAG